MSASPDCSVTTRRRARSANGPEAKDAIVEQIRVALAQHAAAEEILARLWGELLGRDRIGRDVFARPAPEGLKLVRRAAWQADLYDLISAYGIVRARAEPRERSIARGDHAVDGAAARRVDERVVAVPERVAAVEHVGVGEADVKVAVGVAREAVVALVQVRCDRVDLVRAEPAHGVGLEVGAHAEAVVEALTVA